MLNQAKLKDAAERFFQRYPGGFDNPEMLQIAKKHKVEKMKQVAQSGFSVEQFENYHNIIESVNQVVSRSSLISVFEKPQFRDVINSLDDGEKQHLACGLKEFLHGDQVAGFDMMTGLLSEYKLAKWPLVTVFGIYYRPHEEVFIKPTAAKRVIAYFELSGLTYQPRPTFAFYQAYREKIIEIKRSLDDTCLQVDNAAF